jgi:hypothetical protein
MNAFTWYTVGRTGRRAEDHSSPRIKQKAYLRSWYIQGNGGKWASLVGEVFGHSKYLDGQQHVTSPILRLDIPGCIAETLNTIYVLEGKR